MNLLTRLASALVEAIFRLLRQSLPAPDGDEYIDSEVYPVRPGWFD